MGGMDMNMGNFQNMGGMNPNMMNGMSGMNPNMMNGMGGGMNPNMMNGMGGGMNPNMMNGMNPAMMQQMMASMGQGGQNMSSDDSGKMDKMDFQQRLNQLNSDRDNVSVPQGNFNPMMSPNMMNPAMMQQMMMSGANNSNFQMGGKGGAADLMSGISEHKSEIANRLGLDPNAIMDMSADDIGELVKNSNSMKKKTKSRRRKHHSDSEDSEQSEQSEEESEEELPSNKKDLIKMLVNMKKN